ncbi:MAG: LysM peptidoglycan-binding domain-containing protein [Gammaproteobacteria bacterium]|nr:LysM peptidoglycan-binding domain-containing protein [Gammaproteobacteria bacterium]MDH3447879.1 LysM peptidoglycan-binding domain-containing protein [Gammaproteobacteria bacterium]
MPALTLLPLLLAGCASLQPANVNENASADAVAIPLDDHDLLVAGAIQGVAVTGGHAANQPVPYEPIDSAPPETTVNPQLYLDIEIQAEQAEMALEEQQRAEAEVVAAIEASLRETRIKHNAWHRLHDGMQLTPVENARVTAQLNWYLDHQSYLQRVMERARPILPFVLDELEKRDLPTELALLPIVESAYQAFAYSHGRASGMWQIIPSTGRFLGLKQNWWYDGRRDIIESTRAAITYLESLAAQFDGDWELALAAYNAGPGKIRSAVRYNKQRKRPTDFWHLTRIRKETRAYVPKLFALRELFANPDKYQLDLIPVNNQVSYEIVELDGQIDLALAADLAGITVNELYQLNPAFNRWATAPGGPHRLLLPRGKAERFKAEVAKVPPGKRINWVRHRIKNGETLSHISRKYGSSVALIREVNNIRGTQIRAGRHLMVPTATKSLKTYTLSANSRIDRIQNTNRSGNKNVHIVRPGQSLWSISRSYGVTTQALAKWNAMAPIDTLRVGQKLVVWTKDKRAQSVSIIDTRPGNALHALRYTVRKGDSLYLIADRFNISVADIKRWNQVGKYLQPGQKLKLYIDITSQSG